MKSIRSKAKRYTYTFSWCRGRSDDSIFEGCLARGLDLNVRADGLPLDLDPALYIPP